MFNGKKLSILGDSISTYQGISDDASANSTLFYNPYYYRDPFPLERTYWKRLIDNLRLKLCVNNSWSGGTLSGISNPDSGINRVNHLARDDGETPDLIIVFMGINDLGRRVDVAVFSADYEKTLMTIRDKYPHAQVCCVNLPDRDIVVKKQTEVFNSAILAATEAAGDNFFVADLFHSRLNNDYYYMNTLDGLHPSENGMEVIAEVVEETLKQHCK